MNPLVFTLVSFVLFSCTNPSGKNTAGMATTQLDSSHIKIPSTGNFKSTHMTYTEKLLETKKQYPFKKWRENYDHGLTQYTEQNCNKIKEVFDDPIASLIAIGENAGADDKVQLFKKAILKTNQLNDEIDGLIETGEREDLCDLTDQVSIASGLDPENYGDGEGLATEWRAW